MSSATDKKTLKKITSKEKKKSKNLPLNQENKSSPKKIKKTAAKVKVTKDTQTIPQESQNDLKIDLDLEADKLIAEANKGTEACLLYTSPSPRD